jgi:uncharacterized protein YndB with AHSA1/START domain
MADEIDSNETVVVVRRFLSAPRERVFAAWLDPVALARFMRARADATATAEVDARPGGRFLIVMRHRGKAVEHSGSYLEIDPPKRLSFTWNSDNTDSLDTVVTIEFYEVNNGTDLILTHRRLPVTQMDLHRNGWTLIIAELEAVLPV